MIPVNEPLLKGNELNYVSECINTSWISSSGRFIEDFEREWARYCDMKHGIAVCNGTAALEMAVAVFRFPEKSEIIIPAFTIISCAQAVVKSGCIPVLVDCDPKTWCMDIKQIEDKITEKTVGIMPVHIYGNPVDMKEVKKIADLNKLSIIEDAAECHGAEIAIEDEGGTISWKRCGSFGDVSCFSFYANKIITTGEGGMVLTDSDQLAKRLQDHRNLYFGAQKRFLHNEMGSNFRITNIQAAIGLAQLEQIDQFIARKREMARMYQDGLKGLPLQLPIQESWARNVYWMYGVVLDNSIKVSSIEFSRMLTEMGVQTRPFFLGMHEQPVFHKMGLFFGEEYPVCERISKKGFYLPSGQAITDKQIDEVCKAMRDVFDRLERY